MGQEVRFLPGFAFECLTDGMLLCQSNLRIWWTIDCSSRLPRLVGLSYNRRVMLMNLAIIVDECREAEWQG